MNFLFGTMFGMSDMTLAFDSVFGHFLKNRGHKVSYLICNSGLKNCIFDAKEYLSGGRNLYQEINRKVKCDYCSLNAHRVLESFGLADDIILLNNFLPENSSSLLYLESNDLNVYNPTEHALSTTLRNLLIGDLDHDKESTLIFNAYFKSSQLYRMSLLNFFSHNHIDSIICVHGIYQEHGVLVDVAKELGIHVYVYGFTYRSNTFSFFSGDTYHRSIWNIPISAWQNLVLTEEINLVVNQYLLSKSAGGRDNVNYHPSPIMEHDKIKSILNLKDDDKIFTFFTNVLWDAKIYYSDSLFDDGIVSATKFLINTFLNRPNEKLIIRVHPAESKGGFSTRKTFKELIYDNFPFLPSNIILIDSNSDISSYTLAELSLCSIIYGSNIGLELACRGHRVMVIGEAFIKGLPFVYTPFNLDEIYEFLFGSNGFSAFQIDPEEALKYFYFLNFKISIDLDFVFYDSVSLKNLVIKGFSNLHAKSFFSNNFLELEKQILNKEKVLDYSKFNLGKYD